MEEKDESLRQVGRADLFPTRDQVLAYRTMCQILQQLRSVNPDHGSYRNAYHDVLNRDTNMSLAELHSVVNLNAYLDQILAMCIRDTEILAATPVCSVDTTVRPALKDPFEVVASEPISVPLLPKALKTIFISTNPEKSNHPAKDPGNTADFPPWDVSLEPVETTEYLSTKMQGEFGPAAVLWDFLSTNPDPREHWQPTFDITTQIGNIFRLIHRVQSSRKNPRELHESVTFLHDYVTLFGLRRFTARMEFGCEVRNFGDFITTSLVHLQAGCAHLDDLPFSRSQSRPDDLLQDTERRYQPIGRRQLDTLLAVYRTASEWAADGIEVELTKTQGGYIMKETALDRTVFYDKNGRREFHRVFVTVLRAVKFYSKQTSDAHKRLCDAIRASSPKSKRETETKALSMWSRRLQMALVIVAALRKNFSVVLRSHLAFIAAAKGEAAQHTVKAGQGYRKKKYLKKIVPHTPGGSTVIDELVLNPGFTPSSKNRGKRAVPVPGGSGAPPSTPLNPGSGTASGGAPPSTPLNPGSGTASRGLTPVDPLYGPAPALHSGNRDPKRFTPKLGGTPDQPHTPGQSDQPHTPGQFVVQTPDQDTPMSDLSQVLSEMNVEDEEPHLGYEPVPDLGEQPIYSEFLDLDRDAERNWASAAEAWLGMLCRYTDAVATIMNSLDDEFVHAFQGTEDSKSFGKVLKVFMVRAAPYHQDQDAMSVGDFLAGMRRPSGQAYKPEEVKNFKNRIEKLTHANNVPPTPEYKGTLHAETILMSLHHLARIPRDKVVDPAIQPSRGEHGLELPPSAVVEQFADLSSALPISKRCCPSCKSLVEVTEVCCGMILMHPGDHSDYSSTTLPPWLPRDIFQQVYNRVLADLDEIFQYWLEPDVVPRSGDTGATGPGQDFPLRPTIDKMFDMMVAMWGNLRLGEPVQPSERTKRLASKAFPEASGSDSPKKMRVSNDK